MIDELNELIISLMNVIFLMSIKKNIELELSTQLDLVFHDSRKYESIIVPLLVKFSVFSNSKQLWIFLSKKYSLITKSHLSKSG